MSIQPYTSRTDTREILDLLWKHEWRVLVGPWRGLNSHGLGFALENGMVRQPKADERGGGVTHRPDWPPHKYQRLLEKMGPGADFAVVPDYVLDGHRTLTRTLAWVETIRKYTMPLICVADGIEPGDVWPMLGPSCGIFVAGSTEWKWTTLPTWGQVAKRRGCYLHVGRVNGAERIREAERLGAHSLLKVTVTEGLGAGCEWSAIG